MFFHEAEVLSLNDMLHVSACMSMLLTSVTILRPQCGVLDKGKGVAVLVCQNCMLKFATVKEHKQLWLRRKLCVCCETEGQRNLKGVNVIVFPFPSPH